MAHKHYKIIPYSDNMKGQLLDVWEKSVLATHDFLTSADFQLIKTSVQTIDFNLLKVYCLVIDEAVIGFVGVYGDKVEMLFVLPIHFRKGYGKILMAYAMTNLKAKKVDVNEQNSQAVQFYKHFGFKVYERTEKDDQGKDYPLLRLTI